MECILKSAEDINQECTKMLEKLELATGYKSVYTINGKPILPPLMTHERRLQMQKYRQAAMAIEKERLSRQQTQSKQSALPTPVAKKPANNACAHFTDASTNTGLTSELEQQPLIVMGRLKQQLQFSETLIYDNNCNAIIKFTKPSRLSPAKPAQTKLQPLFEESFEAWPQYAVVKEEAPTYGIISETSLETAQKPLQSDKEVKENHKVDTETKTKENDTQNKPKINVVTKDKTDDVLNAVPNHNIVKTEVEQLKRAATSPSLFRVSKNTLIAKIAHTYNDVDHKGPLHPQLWKRFHSYPFESKCPIDRAGPRSPNTSPPENLFQAAHNNKIQVKQCLASEQQQSMADNQKTKVSPANQLKVGSSKSSKRTPRASSNIRYEAHASSHANAHLASSDSKTRVSSTQRRLSYDPRITIKRALTPKKAVVSSTDLATPLPAEPATPTLKQRLLEDMERQQRQRFQLLIMQQTDEQQRMQVEFHEQQQLLMNNLLTELNTYSSDKDGDTDVGNSESSSLTSLPQGRMDLNPNEPDASI